MLITRLLAEGFACLSMLPAGLAGQAPRHPTPYCDECVPSDVYHAPGIGFDLAHGYGTSAAVLSDGTIMDLANVDASNEFMALFAGYADGKPPPPLSSTEKWRRYFNKKLGRPASTEAGVLSELLVALKGQTIATLKSKAASSQTSPIGSLDHVTVVTPHVPGLRHEDLNDAIEYAGMRSWLNPPPPEQLKSGIYPKAMGEPQAAFANDGRGLCPSFKDHFVCEDEGTHMPVDLVLSASLTRQALVLAAGLLQRPFYAFPLALMQKTRLDLGMASLQRIAHPTNDYTTDLWLQVEDEIRELVEDAQVTTGRERLSLVLVQGEHGTHPGFLDALRRAVEGSYISNLLAPATEQDGDHAFNPLFAAARGAARYSRRRQQVPFGCMERKDCDEKRAVKAETLLVASDL